MKAAFVGIGVMLTLLGLPVAHAEEPVAAQEVSVLRASSDVAAAATLGSVTVSPSAAMTLAVAAAKDLAVPPLPPPITLTLKVDLAAQKLTVVENGVVRHVWAISSGRAGYATQTGTFQPQWTAKMWYSRQWDMAPMPNAVFFNKGTAFHATNAVSALGRPASHGCIRLAPANAAKLYAMVHRHGLASTKVVVHGTPKEQLVARRSGGAPKVRNAGRAPDQGYWAYASSDTQYAPKAQRSNRPSGSIWGF